MAFNSISFLLFFLPCFLVLYYISPKKSRNLILFIGSIAFYVWGIAEAAKPNSSAPMNMDTFFATLPCYLLLLVLSFTLNFFLGRALDKSTKGRKLLLFLGVAINLGVLFVFKYSNFVADNLNALFFQYNIPFWLPNLNERLALPIGISFYTFQSLSYIVDVYRKKYPSEGSFIRLGAYVCMFPKLVMGPITTYDAISSDLVSRKYSFAKFFDGIREVVIGLGLKVLLAGQIAGVWKYIDSMIGPESVSTPLAWIGAISFSFQIYFDFCGYSLIAIGLGRMLGFELPQNFNYPYISRSMTDFWRRWHITLGKWFREYVYIPLGGNRKGALRTIFNLFVVWFLTGIWHGANWNFVIWGLFLFVIIAVEKLCLIKVFDKVRPLGHLYMILLIPISWTIFNVNELSDLLMYLSRLFPFFGTADGANIVPTDYISQLKEYGVTLAICILFATPLPRKVYETMKKKPVWNIVSIVMLAGVFALVVFRLHIAASDPFLYFKF